MIKDVKKKAKNWWQEFTLWLEETWDAIVKFFADALNALSDYGSGNTQDAIKQKSQQQTRDI